MTDSAIIAGSLVDVRNVGTHKSVKLTVHVPAELAQSVFAAFGWPTGVAPVSVAIARLVSPQRETSPAHVEATPRPAQLPASAGDDKRRPFGTLPYSTQAALRCTDPIFWAFLREMCAADAGDVRSEEQAKRAVYKICDVPSRKNILPDTEAEGYWLALDKWFETWKLQERVA